MPAKRRLVGCRLVGLRTLGFLAFGLIAMSSLATAEAQQPPQSSLGRYRSLRMQLGFRFDELDMPRFHDRTSPIGEEHRSKHFVVVSMFGAQHAQEVAAELEAVWDDAGRLADHWMDRHRNPRFGIGAVSVMVGNAPRREQPWTPGPRPTNFETDIYVSVPGGDSFGEEQLDELRRESTRALFRVAKIDQVLPAWVQDGLAAYVARHREQVGPADQPVPPETLNGISGASQLANYQRTTSDQMPQPETNHEADAAWVDFLLEGEDGEHAVALFDFIRQAIESPVRQPLPTTAPSPGDAYLVREGDAAWRPEAVLAHDTADEADVRRRFAQWSADPLVGQPVLQWPKDEDVSSEDARTAAEMVVALKLIERFGHQTTTAIRPLVVYGTSAGDARTVRPVVNEFGAADARPNANSDNQWRSSSLGQSASPPIDLASLAQRLRDPLEPGWATVDADGKLLLWTDRERVDELTASLASNYRVAPRDGGYRLVGRTPEGRTIEVWLEANRDQPLRPLARVKLTRP